jgi:hypothetical protein
MLNAYRGQLDETAARGDSPGCPGTAGTTAPGTGVRSAVVIGMRLRLR